MAKQLSSKFGLWLYSSVITLDCVYTAQ